MQDHDFSGFRSSLSETAQWVDKGLSGISMRSDPYSRLTSLASYSLESGGKRVRPFLVRSACLAVGGSLEVCLGSACAVEMIHTYSLIHDDLPAMDDDVLRRGKPTLHIRAGRGQALLAGDLLLFESFGEILQSPLGFGRIARMIGLLAHAAGPEYLVGGQYMDMFHPENAGEGWIERMILGKTAAMIRASLQLGTLAGGGQEEILESVSSLGDRLGFLFQLTDDILDRCGSREEMGKEVSKDSKQGKRNLVSFLGLDAAVEKAGRMAESIASDFQSLPGDWEPVAELALYLPVRRK